MSQWVDRVEQHAVFNELAELERTLELSREKIQEDPALVDHWDRAQRVGQYVRSIFGRMDPLLVFPSSLSNISSSVQQARAEISGFVSSGNVGHWNNAQTHLDNCLSYLSAIPRAMSLPDVEDIREAASSYRRSIAQLLRSIQEDADRIASQQDAAQTKLSELTNEIGTQKQRLDTAISTFQQQFSEAQQSRQNEFAAAEGERENEFKSSEEAREKAFDSDQVAKIAGFETALEKLEGENRSLQADLNVASKELINAIEAHKSHAEKIVGIISATGMVHGYQSTANEERKEAKIWKKVASGALIIWILVAIVFFVLTYDKDLTWAAVARQFLISTPFVLLAGFAALQVSRHQKAERQLRQAELEIASIDPFLATLSDDKRNQAKLDFAARHFGQREVEGKPADVNNKLLETVSDLAKSTHEMLKVLKA